MTELLGTRVHDADGVQVGRVTDVRLVQDGPPAQPAGLAALRLDGMVVEGGAGSRLFGYGHRPVQGLGVLRRLVMLLHREARYVAWDRVRTTTPRRVDLAVRRDELPLLRDLDAGRAV